MSALEIIVIISAVLIVAGVAAWRIIRRIQGKSACGCEDCAYCGSCGKCKEKSDKHSSKGN